MSLYDLNGYVFSSESRCNGLIISCLPYRKGPKGYEYLLREEITPCWASFKIPSSITGGVEHNEDGTIDVVDDVIRELVEETGYTISPDEVISLGTSRCAKSSDSIYFLFSADLTNKIQGEAVGDGSGLESLATCNWVDYSSIINNLDPMVSVAYLRLHNMLENI